MRVALLFFTFTRLEYLPDCNLRLTYDAKSGNLSTERFPGHECRMDIGDRV